MKKIQALGIGSALVASACCGGPMLVAALGLGGLGLAGGFVRFSWWFVLAAVALLGLAWWAYWRERQQCRQAQCQMRGRGITLSVLVLATLVVGWFLLMHV